MRKLKRRSQTPVNPSITLNSYKKELISPEILEIIDKVPEHEKSFVLGRLTSITMSMESHYTSPIPRPEDLQKYNEINPKAAEILFNGFEKQQNHRIALEEEKVKRQLNQNGRGQLFALIVSLFFALAAWDLGKADHDWLGGVLGGATLVSLVTIFILGKKKKMSDKDEAISNS